MAGAADAWSGTQTAERGVARGFSGWIELDGQAAAGWTHAGGAYRSNIAEVVAGDGCQVFVEGQRLALLQGAATIDGAPADKAMLQAIAREGESALSRLRGHFAIVVVELAPARVIAATDRFAVHPLCWSATTERFAFGDRVDHVPVLGERALDLQSLYDYLYFHAIPAPQTIYTDVQRLAQASTLVARSSGVSVVSHWRPVFTKAMRERESDLAERFRQALRAAVERAAGGGRCGAFLSGGTDSSTVAGLLRQARGTVPAYSIGFDADGYDEMEYARLAAGHFGLQHRPHYLTPDELRQSVIAVGAASEQPFGNSSIVPAYRCAQLAGADGIERLLAGDGGDELFGGNTRYARQRVFEVWQRVPAPLRRLGELASNGALARAPLLRKVASYIRQAQVPLPARAETYNLLNRLGTAELLSPAFVAAIDCGRPLHQQQQTWADIGDDVALVDRMLAYDWRFTLAENDLPKVRAAAALAGVDVAFPMLDDEVVDLSLQLAPSLKVHGTTLRPFFKRALGGILPEAIIRKRKHGFGMPFGIWLTRDRALAALVDDHLATLSARGLFAPNALERLRGERLGEHAGYFGEMIWLALMLEIWLRVHAPRFSL